VLFGRRDRGRQSRSRHHEVLFVIAGSAVVLALRDFMRVIAATKAALEKGEISFVEGHRQLGIAAPR